MMHNYLPNTYGCVQVSQSRGEMYAQFGIYVVEGSILFIVSLLILVALIRTPKMAEKYSLIIAQYCTNALMGFGTVLGGAVRLIMMFSDCLQPKSARLCMLMPWNILFTWCEPMMPIMLLVISFDRLLSLLLPMVYFKSGYRLQLIQILVSHGMLLALIIQTWIATFPDNEPIREAVCWTSDAMLDYHVHMYFAIRITTAVTSVLLYVITYFLLRKRNRKVNYQGKAQRVFEQGQRQLTVTMCISCFFTIFLYIMPACLVFFLGNIKDSAMNDFVNWYAIISGDMNSVVNVLIIYWKQTDIADAIRRTLRPLINIQQHHSTTQTAIAICSRPLQVAVVRNNC